MGAVSDHFGEWLKHCTGCRFAAQLARTGKVIYEEHNEAPVAAEVDTTLDKYGAQGLSTILVLPFIRDELEFVDVLATLRTGSNRWKARLRQRVNGTVLVGIDWSTANGDVCDAMGFAPIPTMPVTRRSPYFAIGCWAGLPSNPHRNTPPTPPPKAGRTSFLDVLHALAIDAYSTMWTESQGAVADLMVTPPDRAALYRRVAFVLSEKAADAIAFDP